MFYMYVLFSPSKNNFYVGSSADLRKRFKSHIDGKNFATRSVKDWQLTYYEAFTSRKLAFRREQSLKKRAQAWRTLISRIIEPKE